MLLQTLFSFSLYIYFFFFFFFSPRCHYWPARNIKVSNLEKFICLSSCFACSHLAVSMYIQFSSFFVFLIFQFVLVQLFLNNGCGIRENAQCACMRTKPGGVFISSELLNLFATKLSFMVHHHKLKCCKETGLLCLKTKLGKGSELQLLFVWTISSGSRSHRDAGISLGTFPTPWFSWVPSASILAALSPLCDPSKTCTVPVRNPLCLSRLRGMGCGDFRQHWSMLWPVQLSVWFALVGGLTWASWSQWVCPWWFPVGLVAHPVKF